jgi:hypothetical protein
MVGEARNFSRSEIDVGHPSQVINMVQTCCCDLCRSLSKVLKVFADRVPPIALRWYRAGPVVDSAYMTAHVSPLAAPFSGIRHSPLGLDLVSRLHVLIPCKSLLCFVPGYKISLSTAFSAKNCRATLIMFRGIRRGVDSAETF